MGKKDFDKKLVYSLSKSRIPSFKQLKFIKRFLSNREIVIIRICVLLIFASVLFSGTRFYLTHLQSVPIKGGVYNEALIGSVKHLNPLYASISDVDSDISSLIYSSLFKRMKNGELGNDLLESYEISDDGLTYTLKLREDVYWHDGGKLTAEDVVFTVNTIKDKRYESPLRLSFLGVDIEKIDEFKLKFVLTQAYPSFFELLTFGILPQEIWSQINPEYFSLAKTNLQPIGSGPYRANGFAHKENSGAITQYNLVANENYYGEVSKTDITFHLFASFEEAVEAINSNTVEGLSYLPISLKENIITPKAYNFHKLYLPQQNNLFFNVKNNSALGDRAVRQALAYAIDKNEIVNLALGGNAYVINGPIQPNNYAYNSAIKKYDYNIGMSEQLLDGVDWKLVEVTEEDITVAEANKESEDEDEKMASKKILEVGVGKWRLKQENYFVLFLTLPNLAESVAVADQLKNYWEAIGIKVVLNVVDADTIESNVIQHRNFEVILYGQTLGNDPDFYSFWHSTQSDAGGLNFSNFSNEKVDSLLSEVRNIRDKEQRKQKYAEFQDIVIEEVPAIFIYSPIYTYLQSKKVEGFDVQNIQNPKDRLSNVSDWYTQIGKKIVW